MNLESCLMSIAMNMEREKIWSKRLKWVTLVDVIQQAGGKIEREKQESVKNIGVW